MVHSETKKKSTYNIIPSKNIFHFLREAEYKHKIRKKSCYEKIADFFSLWKLLNNEKDVFFNQFDLLSDTNDKDNLEYYY